MSLKNNISSPLEAGTSNFDSQNLPPHLVVALRYASARLASKDLHITLILVRKDYQLPSTIPPVGSQGSSRPMTPMPGRGLSRSRWLGSPTTPLSPPSTTPSYSNSSSSSSFSSSSTNIGATRPVTWNSCGFRLVYPAGLPANDQRTLHRALQRAERKFNLGSECLTPAVGPAACGLSNQLVLQSILQNEVVFSSKGMTLFALHRLYSLKVALSAYSKTRSLLRLEDAVNELRRLTLASRGCKVTRDDLLRSYHWLSVSHSAVADLDRMYKRTYGGQDGVGTVSYINATSTQTVPRPVNGSENKPKDKSREGDVEIGLTDQKPAKSPSPKAPVLKLQTKFDVPSKGQEDAQAESSARTAIPSGWLPIMLHLCHSSSIDEVLSAGVLSPGPSPAGFGPRTPNDYDDISPTTRGEWGFLMIDDAFQGAKKKATVETC